MTVAAGSRGRERKADDQRAGGGTAEEAASGEVAAHETLLVRCTMSRLAVFATPAACLIAARTRL